MKAFIKNRVGSIPLVVNLFGILYAIGFHVGLGIAARFGLAFSYSWNSMMIGLCLTDFFCLDVVVLYGQTLYKNNQIRIFSRSALLLVSAMNASALAVASYFFRMQEFSVSFSLLLIHYLVVVLLSSSIMEPV
jgi:hypothetical protein